MRGRSSSPTLSPARRTVWSRLGDEGETGDNAEANRTEPDARNLAAGLPRSPCRPRGGATAGDEDVVVDPAADQGEGVRHHGDRALLSTEERSLDRLLRQARIHRGRLPSVVREALDHYLAASRARSTSFPSPR